jgi:NAD(P)H-dependent FMN reductase
MPNGASEAIPAVRGRVVRYPKDHRWRDDVPTECFAVATQARARAQQWLTDDHMCRCLPQHRHYRVPGGPDGCQPWRHRLANPRSLNAMNAFSCGADIKVLALVGNRRGTVYRQLLKLPARMAPAGIELMVGELGGLPIYSEDIDSADLPDSVVALRVAAAQADAALVLSPVYGGRSPGVLRNAIDWLTRPGNGELQDKPLAVVGAAVGGFVGVWSHPAGRDAPHIVERIAVVDLGDIVYRLAAEVAGAPMAFAAGHSAAG